MDFHEVHCVGGMGEMQCPPLGDIIMNVRGCHSVSIGGSNKYPVDTLDENNFPFPRSAMVETQVYFVDIYDTISYDVNPELRNVFMCLNFVTGFQRGCLLNLNFVITVSNIEITFGHFSKTLDRGFLFGTQVKIVTSSIYQRFIWSKHFHHRVWVPVIGADIVFFQRLLDGFHFG